MDGFGIVIKNTKTSLIKLISDGEKRMDEEWLRIKY
jgi:hypothetical protein